MPPFIGPVNYVEILTKANTVARGGTSRPIMNLYHFRRLTTTNPVVKANIEAAFQTAIMGPVLLALSVDYVQSSNDLRYFEDAENASISFPETGVGAITGERYESFTAVRLQLKTNLRGHAGRGGKAYGPLGESQINGDTIVAGTVTLFTAVATALLAGFTDSDGNVWVPGLKGGERVGSPAWYRTNPTTTVWNDLQSIIVNKSLITMRRRRIKTVV